MRLLPARYKSSLRPLILEPASSASSIRPLGSNYVGTMYPGTRLLVHDGERTLSERTARRKYGTSSAAALEGLGLTVERVPRRGRYFAFRGRRSEQKMLRAAIADRERP